MPELERVREAVARAIPVPEEAVEIPVPPRPEEILHRAANMLALAIEVSPPHIILKTLSAALSQLAESVEKATERIAEEVEKGPPTS